MAHGIAAGALLLHTDEHGRDTTWRVQHVSPHPRHLDRVLLSGVIKGGTGQLLDANLSDWVRRVVER